MEQILDPQGKVLTKAEAQEVIEDKIRTKLDAYRVYTYQLVSKR
jgi:hypothetical protein